MAKASIYQLVRGFRYIAGLSSYPRVRAASDAVVCIRDVGMAVTAAAVLLRVVISKVCLSIVISSAPAASMILLCFAVIFSGIPP